MPCKQVGSVTDPDTGDTIEIYQINPKDQCYDEYQQWLENAESEIKQCKEEKCPSTSVSYELEKECRWEDKSKDSTGEWETTSGDTCTFPEYMAGSLATYYHGLHWLYKERVKLTLRRTDKTPSDATGVIFCRTIGKDRSTWHYDDPEDVVCEPDLGEHEESKGKFTMKFDDSADITSGDAPSCRCYYPDAPDGDGEITSYTSAHTSWELEALAYIYD